MKHKTIQQLLDGVFRPADLERKLGYKFRNRGLLRRALTHASATGRRNYERLEFLGDRVVSFAVAEMLHNRYPRMKEGDLAKHQNVLVKNDTLALIAKEIGLDKHLIMSKQEALSGGRNKVNILADAVEAVLGAIYLDGGYQPAFQVAKSLWMHRVKRLPSRKQVLDAKTEAQEWLQARGLPTPTYEVVSQTGPAHAPHFVVAMKIRGRRPIKGEGSTKRSAEQDAAKRFLVSVSSRKRA